MTTPIPIPLTTSMWDLVESCLVQPFPGTAPRIETEDSSGTVLLVVTGLPTGVNSDNLLNLVSDRIKDPTFPQIRGLHDESFRDGRLRLVIMLRAGADVESTRVGLLALIEQVRVTTLDTAKRIRHSGQAQLVADDPLALVRDDWDFVLGVFHRMLDDDDADDQLAAARREVASVIAGALGYDSVVVLTGEADRGLTWSVEASGTDDGVRAMLEVYRDGEWLYGGGGGCQPRSPELMSTCFGRGGPDDDPIYDVLVGVDPSVDQVAIVTNRGTQLDLKLSQVFDRFGVRFGALVLPSGEKSVEFRAFVGGNLVETSTTTGLDRPHRLGPDGTLY